MDPGVQARSRIDFNDQPFNRASFANAAMDTLEKFELDSLFETELWDCIPECDRVSFKNNVMDIMMISLLQGVFELTGSDKKIRPFFVTIHALMEKAVCFRHHRSVTGIIHDKIPPHVFYTKGEDLSPSVDARIAEDEWSIKIIQMRTKAIREFLDSGASLHLFYPQKEVEKRTENQRTIYQEELSANAKILDRPLDREELPDTLCGAFYFFKNPLGREYDFAIQMPPANEPKEKGTFGIWFGLYTPDSPVYKRIELVKNTLNLTGI